MSAKDNASARLTMRPSIYYQVLKPTPEQPSAAELPACVRHLATDDQPFHKTITVGKDWQRLKDVRGLWLEQASLVVIANREGRFTQLVPTLEERQAAEALVVDVVLTDFGMRPGGDGTPAQLHVSPNGLLVAEPTDLGGVWLRCPTGEAKCGLWVYPK